MGYPEGLNQNEKEFLTFHDVKPEQTFNAEGMSKSEYRPLMKRDGQIVAFNTTPCNAAGHQLRTRSGHCVICNSAPLGFQKRNDLSGYVYVAGSILGQMLKVGFSNNYENRELLLNQQNYGGFDDWKNLLVLFSANGGRLELQLHSKLKIYSTSRDYFHDDHYQKATEIFHCSVSKVLEALELVDSNFRTVKQKDFTDYQFRNLTK